MKFRGTFSDAVLQLFGIFALTLGGPAYAMLQANAQFLVAHNLDLIDILVLAAALSLGPIVPATALLLLARRFGDWVFAATFAATAFAASALGLWQLLVDAEITLAGRGAAAVLGGTVLVGLLFGSQTTASFARATALLGIAFPLLFLLDPLVSAAYSRTRGLDEPRWEAPVVEGKERAPVVLVIFDELPLSTLMGSDGRINPHRYPNFARLAATSTWFRNAGTVSNETVLAVPAILTGRYPTAAAPASIEAYPENLFSWLQGGYRMVAAGPSNRLCPKGACEQVGPAQETRTERWLSTGSDLKWLLVYRIAALEWKSKLPPIDGLWRDIGRRPVTEHRAVEEFQALVDAVDSRDASFYFLHSRLPHAHWVYVASGKRHSAQFLRGVRNEVWGPSEWLTIQGYQRHIAQTQFADALLGRLLHRLKEEGVFDRALVVVTADHGVSFRRNRPLRRARPETYQDIIAVPLFIKVPGQRTGSASDAWAETVDIAPTIASVLKQPLVWTADGRSLLDSTIPQRTKRTLFMQAGGQFTSRTFPPQLSADATISRKLALFGSGDDADSLFRVGDARALMGRSVKEFPHRQSGFRAGVDNAALYRDVRLDSDVLPMWLEGHVFGSKETGPPENLAVVLNGTIVAVTQPFIDSAGRWAFQGFLPESALRNGRNQVEIFAIEGTEAAPRLARTTQTWPWRLQQTEERLYIVSADKRLTPVRRGEVEGVLGGVVRLEDQATFIGWAIDRTGRNRQVRVALFIDGVADSAVETDIRRLDVAEHFKLKGRDKIRSGFELKVPTTSLKDRNVRLFAMTDDVAFEIRFSPEKLAVVDEVDDP